VSETPAIAGGTPVRSRLLPYGMQVVDDEDVKAVVDVLRSAWLTTGPMVEELETALAARGGAKHAVVVNSGTAALHAAAFAAGIDADAEAVVTPLTFVATANCVRYLGGRVVFADVQRDTLNIDPAEVAARITPRTRAVLAVDYAGQPADMDELRELTRKRGIRLIDDASHAVGATYKGRPVGSLADLTIFSFHPVKHVTTGEGGAVLTDDAELAARARRFRNHGITTDARQRHASGDWFYEMVDLGFNYRLTDLQCALGVSQLKKLDGFLQRRRELVARYDRAFADVPFVERPAARPEREPAWHLYTVRLRLEELSVGRAEFFRALRAENIGVNVHYIPVHLHPYYRGLGHRPGECPVAEAEYERLLTLPLHPGMTDADLDDVVRAVTKVGAHYRARR
jgi:perosamine synthetase